jgi:hypothetical protein
MKNGRTLVRNKVVWLFSGVTPDVRFPYLAG